MGRLKKQAAFFSSCLAQVRPMAPSCGGRYMGDTAVLGLFFAAELLTFAALLIGFA